MAGSLHDKSEQRSCCRHRRLQRDRPGDGPARPGHFLELSDEVFRSMIEVDYFGTLYAIRAVAPGMVSRGRGSIVAISSSTALLGFFGYSAYAPAKFAVRGPAAISGAIKPITADKVASDIVRAIERRRFAVYSDPGIAVLSGLGPLLAPVVRRFIDRRVRSAR